MQVLYIFYVSLNGTTRSPQKVDRHVLLTLSLFKFLGERVDVFSSLSHTRSNSNSLYVPFFAPHHSPAAFFDINLEEAPLGFSPGAFVLLKGGSKRRAITTRSSMSPPKFESLPGVVLDEVAIALGTHSLPGPPSDVLTMLLLCKRVYGETSWCFVFSRIFYHKFDASAPIRRLCNKSDYNLTVALAEELAKRFKTLRRFKNGYFRKRRVRLGSETLRIDLWRAYIMFLENDGKNAAQLVQYAGVDVFADCYIFALGSYWDHVPEKDRSIDHDEFHSLAMELFWYTEKGRVHPTSYFKSHNHHFS